VALALVVEALAVVGLRAARHSHVTHAADLSPVETAVPVRAVALEEPNAPLLKRGGGAPRARSKAAPAPREELAPAPRAANVDSSKDDIAKATPIESTDREPAAEPESARPEDEKEADAPAGAAPDDMASTELPPGPGGEGHAEGSPDGTETDPLKARAVDLYRARIIAWFSGRFRVSGSGLPPEELERLRASATVTISNDRRVVGYTIAPSGNASFDAAARAALESTVGSSIPPPPESYPDVVQASIHVTFVCRRNQCD
jgi:hypothetical protein